MTPRLSSLAVMLLTLLIGCGKDHESPLPRLETEYPVRAEMLRVSNSQIDGIEVDESTPLRAKRGKPFQLTGNLESGTWNTKSVIPGWRYEPTPFPVIPKTEPRIELFALLHGNDTSKNFGVIESFHLESRPLKESDKSKMEFRVTINPPKYRGRYVIDVQAIDEHALPADITDAEEMSGKAIWRRELWIE